MVSTRGSAAEPVKGGFAPPTKLPLLRAAKVMSGCFARAPLFVLSQSDPCPEESGVALPDKPWKKAHLVAQPFQLIARQRREACRLSDSGAETTKGVR